MKKLLLSLLLLTTSLSSFCQEKYEAGAVPVKDGIVTFTMIKELPGLTKDQLYSNAKMTISNLFKSAKDVIQLDDKEAGIIICKGNSKIVETWLSNLFEFTLKISSKDGKYKVDLYDLTLTIGYGSPSAIKQDCNKTIIDESALKEDGKIKKNGGGKQRKMVIDEKDSLFSIIEKNMAKSSTQENW